MHFSEQRFAEFTLFESKENRRRKSSVSLPHTCSHWAKAAPDAALSAPLCAGPPVVEMVSY